VIIHRTHCGILLCLALLLTPAAGSAQSHITFTCPAGNVDFDHDDHAGRLECGQCHLSEPPGPFRVDETFAHNTCLGCHRNGGAGPTACDDCHRGGTVPTTETKKAGQ